AQALGQHLAAGAEGASVEHKSGKAEIGYWVLSPAATVEAARANKRQLAEKGVADTVVVNEGEHALGVSLGYFKDKNRADKLRAEAQAKGIERW
ncbi:SPOR domain-containing protein, partial [Methylogaea oryzae]|uniref:SPOR domain-containing protein n=1 Tax=Methylogaea oryzae TaxID=1295382 RepID=UPI00156BA3CE